MQRRCFAPLLTNGAGKPGCSPRCLKKLQHPAYRAIIGMGDKVIPLILMELRDRPGHWFEALRAITKQTPVPVQDRADSKKVRKAWLEWGRDQGYLK